MRCRGAAEVQVERCRNSMVQKCRGAEGLSKMCRCAEEVLRVRMRVSDEV